MKRIASITSLLVYISIALAVCCSCKGDDTSKPDSPTPQPIPGYIETALSGYPSALTVKSFTHTLSQGKICSGFIAIADTKANPKLRFNAIHKSPATTPSKIHDGFGSSQGKAIITTNGGFFGGTTSLSLVVSNGQVLSIENQSVPRKNSAGAQVNVYAVRSAFGQTATGEFETKWIYCVANKDNKPYAFRSPLGNNEQTKTYLPTPPTSTTEGATAWTPREAIGGGPTLVKNGSNVANIYYWREVFDGGGLAGMARHPRTAIGATADGKLILIVCDGRGMNNSVGYTLSELAEMMIQQGAVNAINLDGGGSSTIVGCDGNVLNRPSDSKTGPTIVERRIPSAVVISLLN